jgi:hypothetical protein
MALTELVPPTSETLASLARVKRELSITTEDAVRDEHISELISEASALIQKWIGYRLLRARLRETVAGAGRSELLLSRTPIALVESVLVEDEPVTADQFTVEHEMGVLLHNEAWRSTKHSGVWLNEYERPDDGRMAVVADYWAGVFGPDDNILASGISVDGPTKTYAVVDPPNLVAGDVVVAVGFAEAVNNGSKTVASRTAATIVVTNALVTEASAPENARIRVRTLDPALERLCVQCVKGWILGADHDPAMTSEKIGDWSASWASGDVDLAHELPPGVLKTLERYRRYV